MTGTATRAGDPAPAQAAEASAAHGAEPAAAPAAGPVAAQTPVAILPASGRDLERLWPMLVDLHAHEALPKPGDGVRRALAELLADSRLGRAWIAQPVEPAQPLGPGLTRDPAGATGDGDARAAGGTVRAPLGYLVLTFGYSLEHHGRDALVDELYVAAGRRGQGIGQALLAVAVDHCRSLGIRSVHLQAAHANADAKRLYERLGWVRHERHLMTRRLG